MLAKSVIDCEEKNCTALFLQFENQPAVSGIGYSDMYIFDDESAQQSQEIFMRVQPIDSYWESGNRESGFLI